MEVEVSDEALDRFSITKGGFREFCKLAWTEIESDPVVWSWHLDEICKHLEAVSRGELRRLIINVPPGCSKSTIVSVLWPAWDWITHPGRKWMFATFDQALAFRDAMRCRQLVRGDWYQNRWGHAVQVDTTGETQDTRAVFSTNRGGRRLSVTVGAGKATGWHANFQVVDDPTKPRDVMGSPEQTRDALERTWNWWRGTMGSRRSDPRTFSRVIIMQRLHELDLVGRILEEDKKHEYTHLMLPMRFEPERASRTRFGGDVRTTPGELLVPSRFDEDSVEETERELGSQVASAQLQQRPAPATGNIFKREWFHERWRELPTDMTILIQSWDCTFKDSDSADFVAGHIWGYRGGKYYLIDRIHERMGMPETARAIRSWTQKYKRAIAKLIEDKANGPAIEQSLRHEIPGILLITPEGGKISRANAVAPMCEAGNVVLPDTRWGDEILEEIVTFPFARHDDDVDAMTQALVYLNERSTARYVDAMRAVASGKVRLV